MLKALFNTLQKDKPIEWTESKIKDYIAIEREFNLGRIAYLLKINFTSINTNTSTTKTLILTSLAINSTLFMILFI